MDTYPSTNTRREWPGPLVFGATVIWVVATAVSFWRTLVTAPCLAGCSDVSGSEWAESDAYFKATVIVALGGAPAISLLSFCIRLPKTGAVFVVLAFVVAALLAQSQSARDMLRPDPVEYPDPQYCIEHSGGDNRCPGG